MNNWFTADHHWGHANIIKYCNRPFKDVNHMNTEMVRRWNEVVEPGDSVYHLGDLTLGDQEYATSIIQRLMGKIYLIPGGHDKRWKPADNDYIYSMDGEFVKTLDPLVFQKFNGHLFTMCHYPMRSWEQSHHGKHHLHGHSHGTIGCMDNSGDVQLPPGMVVGKRLDVGVDCHNFYPIHLNTILALLGDKP